VLSALSWSVLNKPICRDVSPATSSVWMAAICAVLSAPISAVLKAPTWALESARISSSFRTES
jgi:hypothetical protein